MARRMLSRFAITTDHYLKDAHMATRHFAFPSPGEILREEFLAPLELSAYACARRLGVPITRITTILRGTRAITADTALRLGALFGTSAEFWMNLQAQHDLRTVRAAAGADLAAIVPIIDSPAPASIPVIEEQASTLAIVTISNASVGITAAGTTHLTRGEFA